MTRERSTAGRSSIAQGGLRSAVIAAGAVITTLFLALLLAQGDAQQIRRVIPLLPTVVQQAAGSLPTRPLPTLTPLPSNTPPPPTPEPSATVTPTPTETPTARPTAVPVLPTPCPAAPEGWELYQVAEGDTISQISVAFDVSVELLVEVNCLAEPAVYPGMNIYVPDAAAEEAVCGPPANWVRYTVRPGDTVFSLARRTGTSVLSVINANCLGFNARIYANTLIYLPRQPIPFTPTPTPVPTSTPLPPPPPPTSTPPPPTTNTPAPPTPTHTPAPPTPTHTPAPPTPTHTPAPPTPTSTPPLPTPTNLPLPTATNTPLPPTPTNTPLPPTPTDTPVP